ncbi:MULTISPECIES: hypothetical protein [unclassified Microbacterium]|uniref:hypothetical protein n=1 Tax=unclassified Microbacterium TaxID=2609290 RepID=UPI00386BA16A
MKAGDVLIPLDVLRDRFGVSERTLRYWLKADSVELHRYGDGYKAVRWGDIETAAANGPRWKM